MPRRAKEKKVDTASLNLMFTEAIRHQLNRPNLYAYRPHAKQLKFHKADTHTRLYIGGNRSGKTTGGVVEDIYWLIGRHPYKRLPFQDQPVRGRAVAVDFNYGVAQILLPEFARWLPPSFLINGSWEDSYNKEFRMLTLANKSTLEFKSYDQDLEKFAGTSRHFTHYDEEPPQHIYNECQARLVDTNGYSWLTMTPVEGMSWVYDSLYLPGTEGKDPDISVVEVDMLDNPHIGAEAAERYLKGLDEEERAAREKGHFMEMGGKVFKNFSKQAHVIPPINPKSVANWRRFVSIDHGYNNPTAILWHAVSPNNEVVTFDEHYASEMTVAEHAKVYHERCKGHGFYPDMVVGDPAMQQRNGVTGTSIVQEYAEAGIYVGQANNDVASGINRMVQYLRVDPTIGRPRWRITENCSSLIYEMVRLRWKTYSNRKAQFENNKREEIHKKDDHAADSARYFFSFMPDLAPDFETEQKIMDYSAVLGATRPAPVGNKVDSYFQKPTDNWEISPVGTDFQGFEY